MSSIEKKSIYYPITILSLIILLNTLLVYSIINLYGMNFQNIIIESCKILPYYYIEVFIITALYIISLVSMCKCISIFRIIISVLYLVLFIGSTTFIYIEPHCMELYKMTDDMKPFYYVIVCHYVVSLIIIMIILISYTVSIVQKNKEETNVIEPIIFNNIVDEDDDILMVV